MMTVHDCDSKFKFRMTLSKYRDAYTPTTISRIHMAMKRHTIGRANYYYYYYYYDGYYYYYYDDYYAYNHYSYDNYDYDYFYYYDYYDFYKI